MDGRTVGCWGEVEMTMVLCEQGEDDGEGDNNGQGHPLCLPTQCRLARQPAPLTADSTPPNAGRFIFRPRFSCRADPGTRYKTPTPPGTPNEEIKTKEQHIDQEVTRLAERQRVHFACSGTPEHGHCHNGLLGGTHLASLATRRQSTREVLRPSEKRNRAKG